MVHPLWQSSFWLFSLNRITGGKSKEDVSSDHENIISNKRRQLAEKRWLHYHSGWLVNLKPQMSRPWFLCASVVNNVPESMVLREPQRTETTSLNKRLAFSDKGETSSSKAAAGGTEAKPAAQRVIILTSSKPKYMYRQAQPQLEMHTHQTLRYCLLFASHCLSASSKYECNSYW